MPSRSDIGLFILRGVFGGFMLIGHGWPKIQNLQNYAEHFPDPLGIGSSLSLAATIGAEFGCALAVVLGIFTLWACLPLIFTMAIAALVINIEGSFFFTGSGGKVMEPALLYLAAFLAVFFLGPGRISLDAKMGRLPRK